MFSKNDIKALEWIREHHGTVRFEVGYITFREDDTIESYKGLEVQPYVVISVGFEDRSGKTIEAATLQLQEYYYGSKWNEELKEKMYTSINRKRKPSNFLGFLLHKKIKA